MERKSILTLKGVIFCELIRIVQVTRRKSKHNFRKLHLKWHVRIRLTRSLTTHLLPYLIDNLLLILGDQLLNMGRQLESKHKEENSREISLAESARELCEVKLELSKKTHEMRGGCICDCRFMGSIQFRAPVPN